MDKAEPAILTVVAADMVGAGEWQLQTTVEYVNTREQFGHTLGYFQAVKHPVVNMMIMIDQAKSLVYNAACAIDDEPESAMKFARMANAWFRTGAWHHLGAHGRGGLYGGYGRVQ